MLEVNIPSLHSCTACHSSQVSLCDGTIIICTDEVDIFPFSGEIYELKSVVLILSWTSQIWYFFSQSEDLLRVIDMPLSYIACWKRVWWAYTGTYLGKFGHSLRHICPKLNLLTLRCRVLKFNLVQECWNWIGRDFIHAQEWLFVSLVFSDPLVLNF